MRTDDGRWPSCEAYESDDIPSVNADVHDGVGWNRSVTLKKDLVKREFGIEQIGAVLSCED